MMRTNNLDEDAIELMNRCMQDELVSYNIMRYPKSEEKEVNLTFSNKITEIDNLNSNNHDLIHRSGIIFQYKESGNYNVEIAKFLNYILELPNKQEEKNEEEEDLSLADCFTRDIENLFQKIESKEEVRKMKEFDRKNPEKIKTRYPEDYMTSE